MRHHSLLLEILKTDLYRSGKTGRYTGSSHRRVAMTLAYPPIAPQTWSTDENLGREPCVLVAQKLEGYYAASEPVNTGPRLTKSAKV